ncbi:MAG: hypothetical protein R2805_11620 [Flavobacterium sp.]|uniref:hypothetical protein n=1 Tax=Flavobacterium sp. TaxID=239 RepID=UPI003527DCC6
MLAFLSKPMHLPDGLVKRSFLEDASAFVNELEQNSRRLKPLTEKVSRATP